MGIDLDQAIRAVEASAGALASFHDFDGSLAPLVGESRIFHRHPACRRVKAGRGRQCSACDLQACHRALATRPDGFWKLCHAGFIEWYAPIRSADRHHGALFLGPWRWEGREQPGWAFCPAAPAAGGGVDLPPVPDPDLRARCAALAGLLAAAIAERAGAPDRPAGGGRAARILRLVDERLRGPFALADLAAELGLSASRCGHVVRAELGLTFPALLEQRRMARARELLAATAEPVRVVAKRCGFAQPGYFSLRFRRATGVSPAVYRATPRRAADS